MTNSRNREPNEDQLAVISELDRNIILFASAGTGKTFTVARRVRRILEENRALPQEILCLTFTIKAAGEMREDILSFGGGRAREVRISNIHSFAFTVLKEESVLNPETVSLPGVCDENDAAEMMTNVLKDMGLPENSPVFRRPGTLCGIAGLLKQRRELTERYSEDEAADFDAVYRELEANRREELYRILTFYDPAQRGERQDPAFSKLLKEKAGEFLHEYCRRMRISNLLDFDDLICLTHKAFRVPEILSRWRKRFRYIIIDEMQDTSELEYDTLRRLFPGNHIMMCGDYFQTIYEWRGSNPDRVLDSYIREFDAARFMFARNYRSTRALTGATFGYLQNTWPDLAGRYCPDHIITESPEEGEAILNMRLSSPEAEARWIYEYLEKHAPEDPTRVCIMSRSNRYIAELYQYLARISTARKGGRELRFFTVDNDAKFYRRAVIRDILAFLRILVNPSDEPGFERILTRYARGIGPETIRKIQDRGDLGVSLSSFALDGLYQDGDPYASLIAAFEQDNVVIYDTETTGLNLNRDQIIQLSAIRLNSRGEIIDSMDQMVIPTIPIDPAAEATHHQTMETILARGGIGIREALEKFLAFVKGSVLVGHNNLRFDSPLLRRQLRENGLPLPEIIAEFDTLPLSQQYLPKSVNYKLGTLCSLFGIVNRAAHDALGDITATGEVLAHLLDVWLIPRTEERRAFLAAFRPKFEKIHLFLRDLRENYLEQGRLAEMAEEIIRKCRLRDRYPEEINRQTLDDFLYALSRSEFTDPVLCIRDLLSDASLSGSQMDLLITKLHKIPIITVHQSKGCEFDTVIVAGADDTQMPSRSAVKNGMEQEEARVFYVAITRAKRTLILTSARQKTYWNGFLPLPQSRFTNRIPRELVRTVEV